MPIVDRLQHAWNAFVMNKDPTFAVRNNGAALLDAYVAYKSNKEAFD